ncbi:hypothetical protein GW7_08583 [Heterocephalus glaber]|uniref:Collagen alpha-1(I) chain n=1 Tax=Heterocephalus glaber TaxID=10181 RepID=G5AVV6_HETGA|nr:hypothetical protein GW7_08583 [Heterocephalus glaber]
MIGIACQFLGGELRAPEGRGPSTDVLPPGQARPAPESEVSLWRTRRSPGSREFGHSPKSSKTHRDIVSMDAQALRKRLSHTSSEAARALLANLLLYVLDRAEGPPKAKDGEHRASCPTLPQEASRRPTRFQLLQAKFMGRGREPPLKRTREVGRLISRDRQGPGRSFVNATISKLLEKAQGSTSSPSQRPAAREKPCWGSPGGKSTVKNSLRKFLAAEEKEARERLPSLRPGSTRGPLLKVAGRSTVLAQLRDRFEQSGGLQPEPTVLPVHREGRRSRALRRRIQRPEPRVLHTATMAASCTRTPPARFLACTAEPLPALSIATVVGSPRSWLSCCTKISHLDARRQARTEASLYPGVGHAEPGGNETPRLGILSGDPRGQWKPSESSVPQATAPWDPHLALSIAGAPQSESPCASGKDGALPGHMPAVALLRPASPRDARPAGGDRTVEPTAAGAAGHIPGVEEGAGEAPQVPMTMCGSEDEAEGTLLASSRELLFATQGWLPKPQREAEPCVPPAPPAPQAWQHTQPGVGSPQITVRLPAVPRMPAVRTPQRSTLSPGARGPLVSQGEAVMGRAAPSPVAAGSRDTQALAGLSRPGQVSESSLSAEPGPQGALRDAAGMDHNTPQTVLTPEPPRSTGKGNPCSQPRPSGPTVSVYSGEIHALPESKETKMLSKAPLSHHPTAWKSHPAGSAHASPAPACLPGPGPQERGSLLAVPQDCRQPESPTSLDQSISCGQEKPPGLPTEPALPLGMAPGNPSTDLGKNGPPWQGEQPKTGIPASRETTAAGKAQGPTAPLAGPQKTLPADPQTAPQAEAQALERKTIELTALDEEGGRALSACPCATAGGGLPRELAPSRPSMHRIGATEGDTLGQAQHQAPIRPPPTTNPEDTAEPCPALVVPRPCAPSDLEVSSPSASAEDVRSMGGSALCNSVMSQTPTARHPQSSKGCSLGQPDPAPTEEALPTQRAPELAAPGRQAEPRAVPKAESSGPAPAPAGMGPPESHRGPVHSQQIGQWDSPGAMMTPVGQEVGGCEPGPWAALDLAGIEKPATREKLGAARARDQEHMQGPRVGRGSSPAQGDGTWAAVTPAAQAQGWARGTVSPATDQPGSVAKGAPTVSTSRDTSAPAPSISSQGSPSTRHPTRGDQSTEACPPEPVDGPGLLPPDVGSHQAPQGPAQAGAPVTPGPERERSDLEQHRRLVHFAKYKAQSFSDQRAFDLSFRPVVLGASNILEAPK